MDEYLQEQQEVRNPPSTPLTPPLRRCPTAGEYLEAWIIKEPKWPSSALGGAYTRFTMPDYKQRPEAMHLQSWHGAPMAAILHAFRAVLGNLTPPEFVAPNIKKQLRQLQELYERPLKTGPSNVTSVNAGELSLLNTHTSASAYTPNPTLGPDIPLLPPPRSCSPFRDPSADQVEMQAHDAQQRSPESTQAVSATIRDQEVTAMDASLKQPSAKRRRTSSSSPSLRRHRLRQTLPPSPTPALTRKASTISQHASSGLQPHMSMTYHNGGEEGKEKKEDPFSNVFRYNWRWGPQSSTQEKVERFLRLSDKEDTNLLEHYHIEQT